MLYIRSSLIKVGRNKATGQSETLADKFMVIEH